MYLELYSDEILDAVSLGHFGSEFDPARGDYIKVQVMSLINNAIIANFYSNRLLFRYSDVDDFYYGDYHYHADQPDMGFCTGKEHTDESQSNLQPITIGESNDEPLNPETQYRKHFNIFSDDNNKIYIKPNELIQFLKLRQQTCKIRIHFLRNIKSTLGLFLKKHKDNLIENGNFFAGLEATQTGDLDRSLGRNNFISIQNPGDSKFVLEQDGIGENIYDMRVTGIQPNIYYVFSCWVTWNNFFQSWMTPSGGDSVVSFRNVSIDGPNIGLPEQTTTDQMGSWFENNEDPNIAQESRIISSKIINGLEWIRLFAKVYVNENANMGSINIRIGNPSSTSSDNIEGRRYFTDLRFVPVENFDVSLIDYIDKLKIASN